MCKIAWTRISGGPIIDRLAKGNASAFRFAKPNIAGLDYSFSGIKTSLLYFLRDNIAENRFSRREQKDICASYQKDLIDILLKKLILASKQTGIKEIALGGGVSANSYLRERVTFEGEKRGWNVFLPELRFTTDNAAMIGIAGLYRYREGLFAPIDVAPISRAADYNQL